VRKEFDVNGLSVLVFWYRNQLYAIESRSPAEGAYAEGFIKAKFTQVGPQGRGGGGRSARAAGGARGVPKGHRQGRPGGSGAGSTHEPAPRRAARARRLGEASP
jgi:hypothetical protein